MEELLKLILPFLSTPKNYAQVLKRLASFAFYEWYLLILALRSIPRIDAYLSGIENWGAIGKALHIIPNYSALNISGVVIGFLVAVFTHTFQFHDRISDLFGIRRRFDRDHILVPMAIKSGRKITPALKKDISDHRQQLMRSVTTRPLARARGVRRSNWSTGPIRLPSPRAWQTAPHPG